jgi:hypothetical protein
LTTMPPLSSSARASLRQHLTDNFSQAELEELAFDLGVDAETLQRDTKSEFARALIQHFENRDDVDLLAREALARRPDPALDQDLKDAATAAANAPEKPAPAAAVSSKSAPPASQGKWLITFALAVATLVVIALLAARVLSGANTVNVQPPQNQIASDIPGTPLDLNMTMRAGVDDRLKPRDVWRVRLQAQQPYQIELQSSVQDGVSMGLMQPGTSSVPLSVETTDLNVCSHATDCPKAFTPAVTGDYYIVVYGTQPAVNYELTVRKR